MKLFILLAAVALSNGAKLDKTYLPPSHSQTSGGSGNFLQTPLSGSNEYQRSNGFGNRGPARNTFAPRGNDYAQNSNVFGQNGNRFPQGSNLAQDGNYAQTDNGVPQGSNFGPAGNFAQANNFGNFEGRPERAQAAFERNAAILRQDSQNDGETYAYAFETENGIVAEENGVATNGVEAQGGFSYTGDDGQVYSIRYTADQNGFVPQGDHLPTPPPIPEEILKALEQNARDEAAGIFDDGSYNEAKYGSSDNGNYNGNNFNGNGFNGNAFNGNVNSVNGNLQGVADVGNDEDSVVTDNALFRNQGSRNQGFRGQQNNGFQRTQAQAGVSNTYLPPFRGQIGRNGNRQNARNGYQY